MHCICSLFISRVSRLTSSQHGTWGTTYRRPLGFWPNMRPDMYCLYVTCVKVCPNHVWEHMFDDVYVMHIVTHSETHLLFCKWTRFGIVLSCCVRWLRKPWVQSLNGFGVGVGNQRFRPFEAIPPRNPGGSSRRFNIRRKDFNIF